MKAIIINATYRTVLVSYLLLSVVLVLIAVVEGEKINFLDTGSLAVNLAFMGLLFLRNQYLRPASLVVAALAAVKLAMYVFDANSRYLLYSSNILLILFIALLAGLILYLFLGGMLYIRVVSAHELVEQSPYAGDYDHKAFLNKQTLNTVLVPLSLILTFQSMGHYSDGGCDGGLCGLYFIMHAIPLLITCLLTIIAVNKALGRKDSYFVFLILAIFANTIIILPDYGYQLRELKYPGYAVLGILIFSFALYLYADSTANTSEE